MHLRFRPEIAEPYRSATQRARVMSEAWVRDYMFCPNCGSRSLRTLGNNNPAGDFKCETCSEEYELKSKAGAFGPKIVDGAYRIMLGKISTQTAPNLLLLAYDRSEYVVTNLDVIPRQFLSVDCLQERKPLAATAKRAGWVGCNILLSAIPRFGVVTVIRNGDTRDRAAILDHWKRIAFVRGIRGAEDRGWLLQTLRCIDMLEMTTFSLSDAYALEPTLRQAFPHNNHIRAKLRQQLQLLRDMHLISFEGNGTYRVIEA